MEEVDKVQKSSSENRQLFPTNAMQMEQNQMKQETYPQMLPPIAVKTKKKNEDFTDIMKELSKFIYLSHIGNENLKIQDQYFLSNDQQVSIKNYESPTFKNLEDSQSKLPPISLSKKGTPKPSQFLRKKMAGQFELEQSKPQLSHHLDDEFVSQSPRQDLFKRQNPLIRSLIAEEAKDRFRNGNETGIMTPRVTKRELKNASKDQKWNINIFSREIQIKSKPALQRNGSQNMPCQSLNDIKQSIDKNSGRRLESDLNLKNSPRNGVNNQEQYPGTVQQDFKRARTLGPNSRLFQNANKKVLMKIIKERLRYQFLNDGLGGENTESQKRHQPKMIQRVSKIKYSLKTVCQRGYHSIIYWNRKIVSSKQFEILVIVGVIINSIVIAIYDNSDRDSQTSYNQTLDQIQFGITIFFTVEAVLKICKRGLLLHQHSYLRDPWNWVDFFTVIIGWLEVIELAPNLKFIRTFRVLKPMRSIHAIPGLRRLINSLLKSLTMFLNIVAFLVFFLNFFSIVGVSMFKGLDYNRCHFDLGQNQSNQTWIIDQSQARLCSKDKFSGYQCLEGTFCGNPTDSDELYNQKFFGNGSQSYDDKLVLYGMQSFNNVVLAISTIFQVLTLEGWVFNLYNMQDAGSDYWSPLYFLLIVVFGAFFLINLILAGIMDSFYKVDREIAVNEMKREFKDVESKAQESLKKKLKMKRAIRRLMSMGDAQERSVKPSIEAIEVKSRRALEDSLVNSLFTESIEFTGMDRDENGIDMERQQVPEDQGGFSDDLIKEKNVEQLQNVLKENGKQSKIKIQVKEPKAPQVNIEEKIIIRSKKNKVYRFFYQISTSKTLSIFIMASILVNTIVIFSDQYPITDQQLLNQEILNNIFFFIFVVEIMIKMLGLGVINYLRDSFNVYDTVIIIFSTIEIALAKADQDDKNQIIRRVLIIFRPFRLLRIFKLARRWSSLNYVLVKMLNSFKEVGNFLILLILFMFIYALLGIELYANRVKFDSNDIPLNCDNWKFCLNNGESPRINFDNLLNAFLAVFVIVIGDDWNLTMAHYVRATNIWSTFYFISLTIIGNIVLLNLLLAILLREFEDENGILIGKELQFSYDKISQTIEDLWQKVKSAGKKFIDAIKECLGAEIDENIDQEDLRSSPMKKQVIFQQQEIQAPHQAKQPRIRQSDHHLRQITESIVPNVSNSNLQLHFMPQERDRSLTFRQSIERQTPSSENDEEVNQGVDVSPIFERQRKDPKNELEGPEMLNNSQRVLLGPNNQQMQEQVEENIEERPKMAQVINIFRNSFFYKSEDTQYLQGKSLFLFGPENRFRKICSRVSENSIVRIIVFLMIILQTITLAITQPLSDPDSETNQILNKIDAAISAVFIFESCLKIISCGFLINGKYSYLRHGWNQLDFAVMILSILSLFSLGNVNSSKVIRNLRVVRPLRMITKNKGLKIALQSLANSLKSLVNISIITLFIYFVWGIFGVNFFKGLYFQCYSEHQTGLLWEELVNQINTKWECIDSGGEWIQHKNTFNNVLVASLSLFQISTTEGWFDLMLKSIDSTDIDYVPQQNNNRPATIYFVAFIFIGGQFVLNIFQGIVISTYLREKENLLNNQNLTEMQREWVISQIKVYRAQPHLAYPKNTTAFRRSMYKITSSNAFDQTIFILICINTIVLALNWLLIDPELENFLDIINHVFTGIFTVEAIMKIIGHGRLYFKKNWNLFDLFIVILTYIQIIYSSQVLGQSVTLHATVVRVLKFVRALRIVKKAEMLKKITLTLLLTVPSLANIAFLLFLLLIFYAIVGMNLFGRVMLHDALDHHANFQNFSNAFLTMMRCATGEGWNEIMNALMEQKSILFQCENNSTYEDIMGNQGKAVACGNYWSSLLFFISYILIVSQIFLNLFVAIILDGFDDSKQQSEVRITDEMISQFQKIWGNFDPEATGYIKIYDMQEFVAQLIVKKTRWVRGGAALLNSPKRKLLREFITLMELPMYLDCTSFGFYDVISRLTQTIFKVDFEKFIQTHYYMRDQNQSKLDASIANDENGGLSTTMRSEKFDMDPFISESGEDDGMSWMNARDMLIFETFEDFYADLVIKLNSYSSEQVIGLNEDLQMIQKLREAKLIPIRNKFDSRILAIIPKIISQMRKLIAQMRERRRLLGEEEAKRESTREVSEIRETLQRRKTLQKKMTDLLLGVQKRENLFQILAKTVEADMQKEEDLVANRMMEQQKRDIFANYKRTKTSQQRGLMPPPLNEVNRDSPSRSIKSQGVHRAGLGGSPNEAKITIQRGPQARENVVLPPLRLQRTIRNPVTKSSLKTISRF